MDNYISYLIISYASQNQIMKLFIQQHKIHFNIMNVIISRINLKKLSILTFESFLVIVCFSYTTIIPSKLAKALSFYMIQSLFWIQSWPILNNNKQMQQKYIFNLNYKIMQKKGLTATSFLRSNQFREKYQCGICYEVCIKPVRCKGQCSKIFCLKCVSDTRQEVDRCPYKCSSPFLVERVPDIPLDFYCPYNPSACEVPIKSLASFDEHYRICHYVSAEERYLKKMQLEYRCVKGHQLQFFIGSYQEMLESACATCEEPKLCRSLCRICNEYYCVGCRVPPCAKSSCPIGHSFSFERIANLNFICDICGVSTAVSNDGVYDDSLCNFGICVDCYNKLPDKFDQSKPKELIANISTQCFCGTRLEYVNVICHPTQCQLCKRMKQCPKQCPNCLKRFCISCKLIDINRDGTCGMQHELISYASMTLADKPAFGCMRCEKEEEKYYFDDICKIRLCQNCIKYCQYVTIDKQRPVILKCNKNHVLTYVTGPQDWYDNCALCHQQKIIRLRCTYCNQKGVSFCFSCKPIILQTCYYKHKLRLAYFQTNRQCQICRKVTNKFHHCKKCYFYACMECVYTSQHGKEMEFEPQLQKMQKKQCEVEMKQEEACFHCEHEQSSQMMIEE